jgi:hypothetical protein
MREALVRECAEVVEKKAIKGVALGTKGDGRGRGWRVGVKNISDSIANR